LRVLQIIRTDKSQPAVESSVQILSLLLEDIHLKIRHSNQGKSDRMKTLAFSLPRRLWINRLIKLNKKVQRDLRPKLTKIKLVKKKNQSMASIENRACKTQNLRITCRQERYLTH
jgi:hypothetical protein